MRAIFLGFLILLGGCTIDPPAEKLASKKAGTATRVASDKRQFDRTADEVTTKTGVGEKKPSLRIIHVRSCDCPEDYDPAICGKRSAYQAWSPQCPASATIRPVKN